MRLAYEMPNIEFPTQNDIAALMEANPMLWNLIIADLLSGQEPTYAGRNIKVLQSEPELVLELRERPLTQNEELEVLISKV